MSADIFWIVMPALLIYLLGSVVASARSVRIASMQVRLQEALIGKIASQEELRAYFESTWARQVPLMNSGPNEKALDAVRNGVFLLVAGVAMLVWALVDARVPVGIGAMTMALGGGCLAAGAATRYLAGRWGLIGVESGSEDARG